MDPLFSAVIKALEQIPNALAVIVMAYLFIRAEAEREERRIENAKTHEAERRAHELQINNMWATFFKNISDDQAKANNLIIKAIQSHEEAAEERYKKMRITQDLIQAVREKK
jgi:hypothetical protein